VKPPYLEFLATLMFSKVPAFSPEIERRATYCTVNKDPNHETFFQMLEPDPFFASLFVTFINNTFSVYEAFNHNELIKGIFQKYFYY
jgi:hypothetical protein